MDAETSRTTASLPAASCSGSGFGMVSQVLTVAIQNAVERRDLGIATASANLFRSLGGSVGVALFGALFASGLAGSRAAPRRPLTAGRRRAPQDRRSWPPRRSPRPACSSSWP